MFLLIEQKLHRYEKNLGVEASLKSKMDALSPGNDSCFDDKVASQVQLLSVIPFECLKQERNLILFQRICIFKSLTVDIIQIQNFKTKAFLTYLKKKTGMKKGRSVWPRTFTGMQ